MPGKRLIRFLFLYGQINPQRDAYQNIGQHPQPHIIDAADTRTGFLVHHQAVAHGLQRIEKSGQQREKNHTCAIIPDLPDQAFLFGRLCLLFCGPNQTDRDDAAADQQAGNDIQGRQQLPDIPAPAADRIKAQKHQDDHRRGGVAQRRGSRRFHMAEAEETEQERYDIGQCDQQESRIVLQKLYQG